MIGSLIQMLYRHMPGLLISHFSSLITTERAFYMCQTTRSFSVMRVGNQSYARDMAFIAMYPGRSSLFLAQVNRMISEFISGIPVAERMQYTLSYNLHLRQAGCGKCVLVNQQITPLKIDTIGGIWLGLGVVSLAST